MGTGLLLAALVGCGTSPPPNLLLVTLDTTRADHLHSWGYDRDTSARLDALAAESVVFENLMVPVATTLPSHTSLLTGTHSLEHGVVANVQHGGMAFRPSPSLQTLTQSMKGRGYATGAFLSAMPLRAGTGLDGAFDVYDAPDKGSRECRRTNPRAVKWLRAHADRPFFLWVHYFDPHNPYEPPDRHAKTFKRDGKAEGWLAERAIASTHVRTNGLEEDAVEAVNLYDGEIRYMDHWFGKLLDAVREEGLWDRTVVVVVGDHGEGLGQHEMAGHGGVWREQLHAPLIIRVPGVAPQRVDRLMGMEDVLPTLAGLAHIPGLDRFVGQSTGVDARTSPPRMLYHHSSLRQLHFGRVQEALSVGSWRYVRDEKTDLMFDLRTDPHELADLSAVLPVHAAILHLWTVEERDRLNAKGEALGRADSMPLTPDEVEQLKLLGYVDDAEPGGEQAAVGEDVDEEEP